MYTFGQKEGNFIRSANDLRSKYIERLSIERQIATNEHI